MSHWEQLKNGAPVYTIENKVFGYEDLLEYDETNRYFVLTNSAIKNELNIDVSIMKGNRENAKAYLKEISNIIYSYIYKKKPAVLRNKTEYFLKYDLRNRLVLYLAMLDMIRYSLYGGGNIIGYQPGINFNESSKLDIELIRDERIVSYVTDSILKTNFLVDRNFVEKFSVPEGEW